MQERLTTGSESSLSPIPDESMLRTPSAIEGEGGAISEKASRERGRMLQVRDQMAQLAAENGLKVSQGVADSLLPTPALGHIRNYDEPVEDYLARRKKMDDGEYKGMPGVSLGVALRMELFPTPNTMEHREIKTPEQIAELKAKSPDGYRNLRESVVNDLMPTPTVSDIYTAELASTQQSEGSMHSVSLAQAVVRPDLMPTPKALDGVKGNLKTSKERLDSGHQVDLPNVVIDISNDISWGKFEPAIRRWEAALGRLAPVPTKPDGKDGSHRLNSEFTEWMMGLPEGWITGAGLTRNEELKAAGNGVVPQQAELALRILLQGVDF